MNIKAKITPVALAIALAAGFGLPAAVQASGGGSGPAVTYVAPGQIGEIVVNPYKIAPLTAVIKNGGYQLKDATVRVVPDRKSATRSQTRFCARTPAFRCSVFTLTTTTRSK